MLRVGVRAVIVVVVVAAGRALFQLAMESLVEQEQHEFQLGRLASSRFD